MPTTYVPDSTLEDHVARQYITEARPDPLRPANVLSVRVATRVPNPHLTPCPVREGGEHVWSERGLRECECGEYRGDLYPIEDYHAHPSHPAQPCRFEELATVFYDRYSAALVAITTCGELCVWMD